MDLRRHFAVGVAAGPDGGMVATGGCCPWAERAATGGAFSVQAQAAADTGSLRGCSHGGVTVAWGPWGAADLETAERQKDLCPGSSGQRQPEPKTTGKEVWRDAGEYFSNVMGIKPWRRRWCRERSFHHGRL